MGQKLKVQSVVPRYLGLGLAIGIYTAGATGRGAGAHGCAAKAYSVVSVFLGGIFIFTGRIRVIIYITIDINTGCVLRDLR